MSNDIEYENRQIIPRWLPFAENNRFFNESPFFSGAANVVEEANFQQLKRDWKRNKSLSFAHELVASSRTLNITEDTEILEAWEFIKRDKSSLSDRYPFADKKQKSSVDRFGLSEIDFRSKIHRLRETIRLFPDDAILWNDLSFYYLMLGEHAKAERCINIAAYLGPHNYYIVRSSARFYVYKEDPERAIAIINRSEYARTNPLLVSSAIAIGEAFDLKVPNVKKSFELINGGNFSNGTLTELFATLATIEYNSGSTKGGKKLMMQALLSPNENSLAQVEFLADKFDGNIDTQKYNLAYQFEANAWNSYRNSDYVATAKHAKKWFEFQPFSSRPALLYSYIKLLIQEDYDKSIELLDHALVISPSDHVLLNNKAVALVLNNDVDGAQRIVDKIVIDESDEDYNVIVATRGMIELRKKNIALGNKYYLEATNAFRKESNSQRLARAMYFWGSELLGLNDPSASTYIQKSYDIAKKNNQRDLVYIIEKETPISKVRIDL